MINTSRFSKCLIIFLVYNIMTIFTVSCDGSDTVETEKKIVPDFGRSYVFWVITLDKIIVFK